MYVVGLSATTPPFSSWARNTPTIKGVKSGRINYFYELGNSHSPGIMLKLTIMRFPAHKTSMLGACHRFE